MSCGQCFECDNCVVYCPQTAVSSRCPGQVDHRALCRHRLHKCVGCHICKDVCPTGYIQMGWAVLRSGPALRPAKVDPLLLTGRPCVCDAGLRGPGARERAARQRVDGRADVMRRQHPHCSSTSGAATVHPGAPRDSQPQGCVGCHAGARQRQRGARRRRISASAATPEGRRRRASQPAQTKPRGAIASRPARRVRPLWQTCNRRQRIDRRPTAGRRKFSASPPAGAGGVLLAPGIHLIEIGGAGRAARR